MCVSTTRSVKDLYPRSKKKKASNKLTRHKPSTSSDLLIVVVVVEHERRSAAGFGTPADGSDIAAAEKIGDWRIEVWASAGCILVVVGL